MSLEGGIAAYLSSRLHYELRSQEELDADEDWIAYPASHRPLTFGVDVLRNVSVGVSRAMREMLG